jgi:hypothetical protein
MNNDPYETESKQMKIHVIPDKKGYWRVAKMSELRAAFWLLAWNRWWKSTGQYMSPSPEMWREDDHV